MPESHIALLRAVNLLQHNRLPMKALAQIFSSAGCTHVATYIQSGNVVFVPGKKHPDQVVEEVIEAIAEQHGFKPAVVLRSASELARIVNHNPFLSEGVPAEQLHVLFLADKPSKAAADALTPRPGSQDRFRVRGREVYLCLPNGVGGTRLPDFDRKLSTTATLRNWRTVCKLLEMAQAAA